MSDSAPSYKERKEDFVSNLSGGPVDEIVYATAVAPIALVLWSVLQSRQSFFKSNNILALPLDYALNVAAILLSTTLYADNPLLLHALVLGPALLVYALPPNTGTPRKKPVVPPAKPDSTRKGRLDATAHNTAGPSAGTSASRRPLPALSIKPFVTNYRAGMMIATAVAILAVDFPLFPRRFAKVETWGTSLMDMGVGSFVFSAGMVAARPVLKERAADRTTPLSSRLLASLRPSLPLLVLGVVRLLSVKGLEYAEHVSEYGVHWNFFFTLGFLPPFVALFQSALRVVPSYAALAVILAVGYQVVLESTGLKAYILAAPRVDLLSANREGIFSFVGYLAIFLSGQDTGMYVLPRAINPRGNASPSTQRTTLLMTLGVWCAAWSTLFFLTTNYTYGDGLSVSRRLANLPYVLLVAAFNTGQLFLYCLVDTLFFPAFYHAPDTRVESEAYEVATSRVSRAFNRNGLALFLVANLLTGLVNLTVPTLDVGPAVAMGILVAYTGVLTVLAVALDAYGVSIKL